MGLHVTATGLSAVAQTRHSARGMPISDREASYVAETQVYRGLGCARQVDVFRLAPLTLGTR